MRIRIKRLSGFKIHLIIVLVLLYVGLMGFMGISHAVDVPENTPLSGRELFIKNRCANCHTIGRGRFVGPDLKGVESRYSRDQIEEWMENPEMIYRSKGKMPVNEGYPPMPPLGVPSEEAKAIAQYLLSLDIASLPRAEGGKIGGRVVNRNNEEAVEGVELTLRAYLGDREMEEKKTRTDKSGGFLFDGLPWNRSYAVSLRYKGADYITDKMVFYPEEDKKTLDLPVYEPTDSDRDISVNADHMVIQVSNEEIQVAEIMVFHNGSKNVYIGKENQNAVRETLGFDLPEGASNIQLLEGLKGENVVQTASGFSDTSPFQPGIKRVVYAYTLPYKSGRNLFEKKINYPTQGFILLVSDSGVDVRVGGLTGGDPVSINNERFLRWTGTKLKPETRIRIEIGKPILSGDSLKWVAFGTVLVLVMGGIIYSFIMRKETTQTVVRKDSYGDLETERKRLIKEIAELDDRFDDKEITEAEYREMRSRKKERLIEITRRIKKG